MKEKILKNQSSTGYQAENTLHYDAMNCQMQMNSPVKVVTWYHMK